MWKLLVYYARDRQSCCYVFEFNTETSAKNAAEFFDRADHYTKVIPDPK